MSSAQISACMDKPYYGLSYPCKGPGVVTYCVTIIYTGLLKHIYIYIYTRTFEAKCIMVVNVHTVKNL
jgi:hypothetical protein